MVFDSYKEYIDFLSECNYIHDILEISQKIRSLVKVLASNRIYYIKSKTKEVYESTDFEGIEIKNEPPCYDEITQAKRNCCYIINRLIVLGFKKIAEHELENELRDIDITGDISTIYNSLKLALKKHTLAS